MQKRNLALFLAVVAVALVWRYAGLTFDSLWLDEGYQSMVDAYGRPLPDFFSVPKQPFIYRPAVPASPSDMMANFRSVDPLTPPLYQLLLNRWITTFGGSDFAVRSLSVWLSTAGVAAVYWLAYWLFGWRAALLTGLIQAFSPFDVYYGQEVRMYALEELSAAISCGLLISYLLRRPANASKWLWLAVYALATWALINSHYTGLFLFAYEIALVFGVCIARRSFALLGELILAWLAVGALWLPWFKMFLQAASLRTASFYVARQPSLVWPIKALFFRIPSNWVMFLTGKAIVAPALPLVVSSVILLLLFPLKLVPPNTLAWLKKQYQAKWVQGQLNIRESRLALASLWLWAFVPALILWVLDVKENHRVIEISRYMMATAPAIYLIAGAGLASLNWRRKLAWGLIICQLLFAGINNIAHATVSHQREPWRDIARMVDTTVPPEQLLIVSQYYDIVCLDRYLQIPHRQVGASSNTTTAQLLEIVKDADRFWLVTGQEGDRILQVIPPQFRAAQHWDLGHSLHLWLFVTQ